MRDSLMARWSEVGDKLVQLAEEFPAERYDYRPVPEVRSFAEQLRHLAFWNLYVVKTLRREEADGEANELPATTHPTRAEIVPALRESHTAVRTEYERAGAERSEADTDLIVSFLEHAAEHYGQLVVYFRLNGLVPPASR